MECFLEMCGAVGVHTFLPERCEDNAMMWMSKIPFGRLYALDEQRKKVVQPDGEGASEAKAKDGVEGEVPVVSQDKVRRGSGEVKEVEEVVGFRKREVNGDVGVKAKRGVRGSGVLRKQAIHIKLDPDIIAHFKKDGSGYQTRINQVLRYYVEGRLREEG